MVTDRLSADIIYVRDLSRVDWDQLKADLAKDQFDNGRTPEQLRRSFVNSHSYCFACVGDRVIAKARILSDGVCNAYLVDVWTLTAYRRRGIASRMIQLLLEDLPGQHIYLQSDEDTWTFYSRLGFRQQPQGLSLIVGRWLEGGEERGDQE